MKAYDWTYSTLIYNKGSAFGQSGLKSFKDAYEEELGFCLSDPIAIPDRASDADFDIVVNQLIQRGIKGM